MKSENRKLVAKRNKHPKSKKAGRSKVKGKKMKKVPPSTDAQLKMSEEKRNKIVKSHDKLVELGEEDKAFFDKNPAYVQFFSRLNVKDKGYSRGYEDRARQFEEDEDGDSNFKQLPIKVGDEVFERENDGDAGQLTRDVRSFGHFSKIDSKAPKAGAKTKNDRKRSHCIDGEGVEAKKKFFSQKLSSYKDEVLKVEEDGKSVGDDDFKEVRVLLEIQKERQSKRNSIALLASKFLSCPEENLANLKSLKSFTAEQDLAISKIAIVSLMNVYLDVLPGYRIQAKVDKDVRLSKEVYNLQKYESALLENYRSYLEILMRLAKLGVDNRDESLAVSNMRRKMRNLAVKCLGRLLLRHLYFNFRSNIVEVLIPLMNGDDEELAGRIAQIFVDLFKSDSTFQASLEVVKMITKYIKSREYKVSPMLIKPLFALPLTKAMEDDDSIFKTSKRTRPTGHFSRKQLKDYREKVREERKMAPLLIRENQQLLQQTQIQILKSMFLLFFHILKKSRKSHLIPFALEGMATFSHLINIELIINLISILRDVLSDQKVTLDCGIYCIIAAFQVLKLQGESLKVDLKDFYIHFYRLLDPLILDSTNHEKLIPLAFRALELIITQTKVYSVDRVAAYAKKLLSLSLHLNPHYVLPILVLLNKMFLKYPKLQLLLDNECLLTQGDYDYDVEDPEHCNPFSTSAWEFVLLCHHYHPSVGVLAKDVFNMESVPEQSQDLLRIFDTFNWLKHGFVPPMKVPTQHVFAKSMKKKNSARHYYWIKRQNDESSFIEQLRGQSNQWYTENEDWTFLKDPSVQSQIQQ